MARGGDKKRLEENRAHIQKLQLLIIGANVAFVIVRLLLKRATAGKLLYVGFALTSAVYAFCYKSIHGALSPVYGAGGELVYAGQDLAVGGALSYFHDLLYIALFVQLAGCLTDKAWWTFMLVPAYALYMAAVHIVIPWWNTPRLEDIPESEVDRKRREKRERQQARAAKFQRG